MAATRRIAVLGPQRLRPTVDDALGALGVPSSARIATVTAGWEEREDEDQELHEHLGSRCVNLRLYERADKALREDAELRATVRWRTERLREVQELYRLRLGHALAAALELLRRAPTPNGPDLLASERGSAIEAMRALDVEHEKRVAEVRAEFVARCHPGERPSVRRQREDVEKIVEDCAALCVAGGHVAILLDVLRLFDFATLVRGKSLVCWSAGAMALSERVVLFHDNPPQGAGSAEVLESGLGLVSGLLPLPHARVRLRTDDPLRVTVFARRFRPLACIPLDEGCRVTWDGKRWHALPGTRRLSEEGVLAEVGA